MNFPLVSIIVPCYNSEEFVKETLESLVNQTYRNIEIIIVNDGSTDSSEKAILSVKDERIKYFFQENKGQCAALNFGFSKSNGQYIKFYDSDDILHSETIASQVASLETSNDEDISFIEWRRFYKNVLPNSIDHNHFHTIHKDCTPLEYLTFTGKMPMVQCGLWLIPRKIFNRSGLWDERLSLINDTEFFTRLLPHAKQLKFATKGYTLYRTNINSNSLSQDVSKNGIKSALLSIDLMAKWLLKIEDTERMKKIIANSYHMILGWAFPKQIIYSKIIERRLANYPSSYIQPFKVGNVYRFIKTLFGWKIAARLNKTYYRIRYNN